MHDYFINQEAEDEYNEAIRDYYLIAGESTAERFIVAFEDAILKAREHPNSWSPIERGLRKLNLKKLPYAILYYIHADKKLIVILAVPHHKQRPGYWRDRL